MKRIISAILFSIIVLTGSAQKHTVGLISADNSKTYGGYNLIYPDNQSNVYLLDNCGKIVHIWADGPEWRPGKTAHLLKDGSIIKTKVSVNSNGDPLSAEGAGATIEKRDWNNNLLWSFSLNDSLSRLHHDIEPMPNGNILILSWERKSKVQAIEQGRDPASLAEGELWSERILEVKPVGMDSFTIVWEWRLWDHLVQDFDSTKLNYGNPKDMYSRVNLNFAALSGAKNWSSLNAISYNLGYDLIVVGSSTFNEVWVIDHSTTTKQAATRTGGVSKIGGDLMYRWGNPAAYNSGSKADQRLFNPNNIQWIGKDWSDKDFGRLIVFNNLAGSEFSSVNIIDPSFDYYLYKYLKIGDSYMPKSFSWAYKRPDSTSLFSSTFSSVQRLENENTLICSAEQGYIFEINSAKEVIWEYVTPMKQGSRVKQGASVNKHDNTTCRAKRYPEDFPAFIGKDLNPKGFIELEPDSSYCNITNSIHETEYYRSIAVYPNPARSVVYVENDLHPIKSIQLYSVTGELIKEMNKLEWRDAVIDVTGIPDGFYFLSIDHNKVVKKLEVRH